MEKQSLALRLLLLFLLFSLLGGCAGKGKDVKTIKGDPEELYKQGLAQFNKRDYPGALKVFEQIKSSFPDSPPYTIWAELKVGDCHFFNKDYVEAIAAYEEFKKIRPTHEEITYVHYQIGMAHFHQMRTLDRDQTSTKKALSTFEYLVANYPPNLFSEKATEKIGVCKKQLADHELYVGNFYYKRGKYQAAASRLEGLQEKFPRRFDEDKALFLLGKSYLELDQWEKSKEAFSRIVNEFPKSSHYKEAKSILDQGMKEKTGLRKTKASASRKKGDTTEKDSGMVTLVKFDEEVRQPVLFREEKVRDDKAELRRDEKKVVSTPASPKPVPPPVSTEEAKKVSPPLVRYEEEGRQVISPPPQPFPKTELKVEAKPEDEKRMAALPLPSITSEPKEIRKAGEVPQEKEREEKAATLTSPTTLPKEKEGMRKESLPSEIKLGDTSVPIDITSDRVETYSKENLIVFKGNVMARQKDMVIYSDSLEAMVFEDGKGIEKVVAGGNVKIQQGLRLASCQKAVFMNREQKVVLTGDPKVWEGENMVSGEEIIFDIGKNRVEVKGGTGGRGKVKLIPGDEIEKLK